MSLIPGYVVVFTFFSRTALPHYESSFLQANLKPICPKQGEDIVEHCRLTDGHGYSETSNPKAMLPYTVRTSLNMELSTTDYSVSKSHLPTITAASSGKLRK